MSSTFSSSPMMTAAFVRLAWAVVGLAAVLTVARAGQVVLPFDDDFEDSTVGSWVGSGGVWTHNGSSLNHALAGGVNSSSVEIPELGGANSADFTVSQTIKINAINGDAYGFGLLSGDANFGAASNSYYLVDIGGGALRIAQIDINAGGGVGIGDTGLQTVGGLTLSTTETYTLSVAVTYGAGNVTIRATVDSDGGDTATLSVTDSTPLAGQHFGIETFGTGGNADFDDFRIVLGVGNPDGGGAAAGPPPAVTNDAPGPGKRVRVVPVEYAGTSVYHTLYLPPGWEEGGSYPVIVEFAPNQWNSLPGTVEDTHLGYYQSEGKFIWVTMPAIDYDAIPKKNAVWWWGGSVAVDATGQRLAANYALTNLVRILEDYGGDPSSVFVTGFSRGAIACGYIGLCTDEIADAWIGFLPHSHHDGASFTPDPGDARLSRIDGRASLITYGQDDDGRGNSLTGLNKLEALGFPVESYELAGLDHTDEWITDGNTQMASSDSNVANVVDVRARMREWIAEVIASKPGTSSIGGTVRDNLGRPLAGARVQSGRTHWAYTDENGEYELKGLVDGNRSVTVSHPNYRWEDDTASVLLDGADLTAQNFKATSRMITVIDYALNEDGTFTIDFTGPANSTYEIRKASDLGEVPFPVSGIIAASNAPVTTDDNGDGTGVGRAIIGTADLSETPVFFQIGLP